jgi:predicted NBD/HSP70 family sugar kinase
VDVDVVVLGGGLTGLGERLLEPVREALRTAGRDSRFIASLELEQRVLLVDSSVPAAAFGAALVGRTEVRSNG